MELKRVVVTGLGAITPLGKTVNQTWEGMINGVSGADKITRFDTSQFKTKFACEVKNYNPEDYFSKKDARKLDRFTQYALISAEEAMKDANIDLEKTDLRKAGVIWGSGIGGMDTFIEVIRTYLESGQPRFNPFFIPKLISDIAAGHISIKYGFMGPNFATVSACATSANALVDAYNYIRLGKANLFISGGSEASINEAGVGGFNAMKAISVRNDDPKTASRPFDADRDGFVLGDGGTALILEEYEHAKKRGAKIYAEFAGGGLAADAHHVTAPHPEGFGASLVMENAMEDAGIKPEDVDYINTHGTSTPLGDIAEVLAIKRTFGEHAYKLSVNATKSMTGHLLGAAGALECMASVLSIKHGIVPPTINHFNLDPKVDPKIDFTFDKAKERDINIALCNNFGFGGHNVTIVIKKI